MYEGLDRSNATIKSCKTLYRFLIGLILLISATSAMADQGEPIPVAYHGYVTIDGMLATSATVSVYDSTGQMLPQEALFSNGSYSIRVAWDNSSSPAKEGVYPGETLTFKVNGITATTWTVTETDRLNTEKNLNISTSLTSGSSSSSSGGGGGGGGGSSGTSGENFTNIELKEKYEEAIYKDKTTSYRFKADNNPVIYINITGNINAGLISTTVEVLKGISTLVTKAAHPPGIVYKNLNLWVGTSGFGTSKNIKGAVIGFKVLKSWITDNDIEGSDLNLVRWDGTTWVKLETEVKKKDEIYTYFEAKTTAFSPFAITARMSGASLSVITPTPSGSQTVTPAITETPPVKSRGTPAWLIIVTMIFIAAIAVLAYLEIKKRKENGNK